MNTTNAAGVAVVTSTPFWLDALRTISEVSALIAPLMGVAWLGIQIWAKMSEMRKPGGKK